MTTLNETSTSPLPLAELKRWMSDEVYSWIEEGDKKQEELNKELEENSAYNVSNLFGEQFDKEYDTTVPNRIQCWSSSSTHLDGIGGFQSSSNNSNDLDIEENAVTVVFAYSESYRAHGDMLWSSARHVANVLVNPSKCRDILEPMMRQRYSNIEEKTDNKLERSPIYGVSFLEMGAGAGVPSWAAMKCGARVVCTDLSDSNRIRTMGECAERNFRQMKENGDVMNGDKTRVCPHDWGSPGDKVLRALNSSGEERFDVIVAADCCYMPWLHEELLDSIDRLLSDIGVAIIAFALHDNTDDDDVWRIVDRAKDKGFVVEVLPSQQLSPPTNLMKSKQGLVHTVRLTKN